MLLHVIFRKYSNLLAAQARSVCGLNEVSAGGEYELRVYTLVA